MAPYLSLLPVRKNKPPPSALPQPKSTFSSTNNPPLPRPEPLEQTQSRVEPDLSALDFDGLLGREEDEDEFGLLNDEEIPDFLVEQSMWTVGGRTPAKQRHGEAAWDDIDEEEEEDVEPLNQYDDSDGQIQPEQAGPATPVQSTSSTSFSPRPASTPSFRQSPVAQGQALFDEEEPSMNGNYTSNSNRSQSYAVEQEERDQDSTFSLEREQENLSGQREESPRLVLGEEGMIEDDQGGQAEEPDHAREDESLEEMAEKVVEADAEIQDFDASQIEPMEEMSSPGADEEDAESVGNDEQTFGDRNEQQPEGDEESETQPGPGLDTRRSPREEELKVTVDDEARPEPQDYSEEGLREEMEGTPTHAEQGDSPILRDLGWIVYGDEEGEASQTSQPDTERDTEISVKFGDREDPVQDESSVPRAEEEATNRSVLREAVVEPSFVDEAGPVAQEIPRSSPRISPVEPSTLAPRPQSPPVTAVTIDPEPVNITAPASTISRPRPSFSSSFASGQGFTKRARHSIAATLSEQAISDTVPARRRRQSVATVGTSLDWLPRVGKGKDTSRKEAQVTVQEVVKMADQIVEASRTSEVPPASVSLSSVPNSPARPASISYAMASPSPPRQAPLAAPSPSNALASNASQQSASFEDLSNRQTPSPSHNSLVLSPAARELSSLEGDTSLPLMGAPLDFNRSADEIGHSTPARLKTRRRESVSNDVEESFAGVNGFGGYRIETIAEVTEEETSFEVVRDKNAGVVPEEELGIKVEADEEKQHGQIREEVGSAADQAGPSTIAHSPPHAIHDQSPELSAASDDVRPGVADIPLASPLLEEAIPLDRLPLPLPVEAQPGPPKPLPERSSSLATSRSSPVQPPKRSIRVSLAAPPPARPRHEKSRRASTSVVNSSHVGMTKSEQARRERERKRVQVSLAAPPPSTIVASAKPRPSKATVAPVATISTLVAATVVEEPQATPEPIAPLAKEPSPADRAELERLVIPSGHSAVPDSLLATLVIPTTEAAEPPVLAAETESIAPVTSPNQPQAPLPASASSIKPAALTLPTTFSFGSTSTGLTREQERQKRKEERERREKRVEEALKAKKQSLQRGAGWKKPEVRKEGVKRKADQNERVAKRHRIAPSEAGSAGSRPRTLKAATSTTNEASSELPVALPAAPVHPSSRTSISAPSATSTASLAPEVVEETSTPVLKLTKATLEANRVATGPRIDLKRRISTFLEGIDGEEDVSTSTGHGAERTNGQTPLEGGPSRAFEEDSPAEEPNAPLPSARIEAIATTQAHRAPPPPPAVSRPPSRNEPGRTKPSTTRAVAEPVKRKPLAASTTTAKPFTFAAPRQPRAVPSAPASNASTASPMFVERLSAWKAREKEAIGKGKRKAPPPMPFKTKNVQAVRPNSTTTRPVSSDTPLPPAAKRARVAPSTSEQGRGGKENQPSRQPAAIVQKVQPQEKPVQPVAKVVGGVVAEEMEKRLKEKLEWSERQKKREEEVKKRKEAQRLEEAEQERKKLQALRAALTVDRRAAPSRPVVNTSRQRAEVRRL